MGAGAIGGGAGGYDANDDFEIVDEDDPRMHAAQSRIAASGGAGGGYGRQQYEYDDDEDVPQPRSRRENNQQRGGGGGRNDSKGRGAAQQSSRPKTGHKGSYNVDSSYYLDDPNYD
jgi:hypothetical protein